MKLGSDTTSYTNYLLAKPHTDEPYPQAGEGATILRRSDRLACTVIEAFTVNDRLFVRVQEDAIEHEQSLSGGDVSLRYICNPNGPEHVFFKAHNGYWQNVALNKKKNVWEHHSANSLHIGMRQSGQG